MEGYLTIRCLDWYITGIITQMWYPTRLHHWSTLSVHNFEIECVKNNFVYDISAHVFIDDGMDFNKSNENHCNIFVKQLVDVMELAATSVLAYNCILQHQ